MSNFAAAIGQWAAEREEDLDEITVKSVLELRSRLIVNSPVDTGRFRGNWQYGVSTAPQGELAVEGTSESPAPPPPAPSITGRAFGFVHYLVNNLPYAARLEDGYSGQAPRGIVALRIQEWPQIVAAAAASVRR